MTQNINYMIYKIRNDKQMEKYFLDKKSSDICFTFPLENSYKISAHKIILAMRSEVFHTMFYSDGEFDQEREIKIVDATAADFRAFLRYFYCSSLKISNDNVAVMMYLADKYAVNHLSIVCNAYLVNYSSFDDTLTAYRLAITFRQSGVKQFFEGKIRKQTKEFFASVQLSQCSSDELKTFLQLDRLNCDAKDVFNALMLWSKNVCDQKDLDSSDMKNRRAELGDCFELIPFRSMERKHISEIAKTYCDLFESYELVELIGIMAEEAPVTTSKFKRKLTPFVGRTTR